MKQKIIMLFIITVLIINTFSVGVLATNNPEDTMTQPSDISENNPETLPHTPPDESTLHNGTVQQVSSSIVVNENDITRDNCVILAHLLDSEYVEQFMKQKNYPFVIDLTSFDNPIDSIMFPDDLLDILVIEEQPIPDVNNSENPVGTDNEVDSDINGDITDTNTGLINGQDGVLSNKISEPVGTQTNDIVLKVITKNAEYSWKAYSLKNSENTNGFLKISCAFADHTIPYEIKEADVPRGQFDLRFNPQDDENRGFFFFFKDDAGYWNITSECLLGSNAIYVISIIFLVVLTFVLIIAVNLLLIKIYRIKK